MKIFIYCKVTLHVSGVTAPIINCTYIRVTSGFRRGVNEICGLLVFHSALNRRFERTNRSDLQGFSSSVCLIAEDGTVGLFQPVGNKLPFHAA
jgi:hypothetical protein